MKLIDLRKQLPSQPGSGKKFPKHPGVSFPSRNHPIDLFPSLSLEELGTASLLERQETKYFFPKDKLLSLLPGLESEYLILEIHGLRFFDYHSIYFDTPERLFYLQHQAGALPRWKIRQRTYLNSGISFLEVKHRDNRRVTHKHRQLIPQPTIRFSESDLQFLRSCFPNHVSNLIPVLETCYTRITLVHKDRRERITIDHQLRFSDDLCSRSLANLVVVEVKQSRLNPRSPFISKLKQSGVRPGSFSKYCIGSSMLHPELKHNRFKPILHQINTLWEGESSNEWPL
jgi:hypothetical protein